MYNKNSSGYTRTPQLLTAGFALLFAASVFAEDSTPNLDEARRLLKAGQARLSAALLEQDLLRFAGNADYDYLLGLALYQSGQSGEALFAFERVMMSDPDNIDARFKAVQINIERGNAAAARRLLTPLDQKKLDEAQRRELDRLNGALASRGSGAPLSLQGYVLGGIGWDDNVSSGPGQSALFIPGLSPRPPAPPRPTALGTAAQASDLVGYIEGGLTLRKAVADDLLLIGAGNLHQGFNRTRTSNQEGYANLELGAIKGVGRNLYGFSLMAQNYLINNAPYRNALGARINLTHSYEDNAHLVGYLQFINFSYPGSATYNATRKQVGISREFVTGERGPILQLGAYAGQENAHDVTKPHFSYRLWGVHAGARVPVSDDFSLSAGANFESQNHLAIDPLYSTRGPAGASIWRVDTQRSLGISADYRIDEDWHLIPLYTHTRNASNLALYTYSRNAFMMQLKQEFR